MESDLSKLELYLASILAGTFCLCWGTVWISLRSQPEVLSTLIERGYLLRIVVVVFVVITSGFLALVGALTTEVSTMMAGIAGYVLGGISKR